MRKLKTLLSAGLAGGLSITAVHGELDVSPSFNLETVYTHSTSDLVGSYDWTDSGDLYYITSSSSFLNASAWRATAGSPVNIYSDPNQFGGASLVSIGDYVYFNSSDFSNTQNIWKYGPLSGASATQLASTTNNYGLYKRNGDLFITGAQGFGTNQIFYSDLDANGDLVNDPAIDLGTTFGASGPLAFDASGNLYYAPGFGDQSIYRWSAAQVVAALADPNSPLPTTGVLWYDYSGDFSVSGGTGMVITDEGDLVLSLTDFTNPSLLVEFGIDESGEFDGFSELLSSTGRLGDVRYYDGYIHIANDNEILRLVPEPSGTALILSVMGALVVFRVRRRRS